MDGIWLICSSFTMSSILSSERLQLDCRQEVSWRKLYFKTSWSSWTRCKSLPILKQSMPRASIFPGKEAGSQKRDAKKTGPEAAGQKKTRSQEWWKERVILMMHRQLCNLWPTGSPWEIFKVTLKRKNTSDNELMYKLLPLLYSLPTASVLISSSLA